MTDKDFDLFNNNDDLFYDDLIDDYEELDEKISRRKLEKQVWRQKQKDRTIKMRKARKRKKEEYEI